MDEPPIFVRYHLSRRDLFRAGMAKDRAYIAVSMALASVVMAGLVFWQLSPLRIHGSDLLCWLPVPAVASIAALGVGLGHARSIEKGVDEIMGETSIFDLCLRVDPEGLQLASGEARGEVAWSGVHRVVRRGRYVFVQHGGGEWIVKTALDLRSWQHASQSATHLDRAGRAHEGAALAEDPFAPPDD